jgi:hypothetical protein
MSKGLGHIQRAIVELIAAEPDGAWQTSAICSRVYGISKYAVSKSKRVAVTRRDFVIFILPPRSRFDLRGRGSLDGSCFPAK